MDIDQVIKELQKYFTRHGYIPVIVTHTEDGLTFWPEELTINMLKVKDGKLYIG